MGSIGTLWVNLTANIKQFLSKMSRVERKLNRMRYKLGRIGRDLTYGWTLPVLAAGGAAVKFAADWETAFAGVRKTVDATEAEFASLAKGIRDMATKDVPAAATEIAGVVEAAGQLGIANEHLLSFARTMIDLGETTDLQARQAAVSLARLANITQMPETEFDRLGSTVVDLGNNFAAFESEIVEMSLRIAGAGKLVNMTEAEILAFGTAMVSVGLQTQAGGTAISRTIKTIATAVKDGNEQLDYFAKVAGTSAADFKRAFETDAAGAVASFIEGLKRLADEGVNVFAVLELLELGDIRVQDTLLRAAGAGDELRKALERGRKAWVENNALTDEARKRYQTLASQWKKLINVIKEHIVQVGTELIPKIKELIEDDDSWLRRLISDVGSAAQAFMDLTEATDGWTLKIIALSVAIGPVITALSWIIRNGAAIIGVIKGIGVAIGGIVAFLGGGWAAAIIAAIAALMGLAVWGWIKQMLGMAKEETDELTESTYKLNEVLVTGKKHIWHWTSALAAAGKAARDAALAAASKSKTLKEILQEWAQGLEGLADATEMWGDQWAQTLADAIIESRLFKLQWRDFIEGIIRDLLYLQIRQSITMPVFRGLQDWLGIEEGSPKVFKVPAVPGPQTLGLAGVGGAGASIVVNVSNYSAGSVDVQQKRGPGGESVIDIVVGAVKTGIGRGDLDQTLSNVFGLSRKGVGR